MLNTFIHQLYFMICIVRCHEEPILVAVWKTYLKVDVAISRVKLIYFYLVVLNV